MEEVWKGIIGFEERYEVSNLGRVRSLLNTRQNKNVSSKILKINLNHKGYPIVTLVKNCKYKGKSIHRLVAEAFIENPNNLPHVNHIDGNKLNNNVSNLEWISNTDNIRHAFRNGLFKRGGKIVLMYSLSGEFMGEFDILSDVTKKFGVESGNITRVLDGRYKQANGYIFKYKN
jgi:hypothetical protein